ncbi:MAG TPA: sensor histidine kinase [Acidimicrobiales bacterium]|jgi:signal transduction histidine kinase|nr:sensor histidine kinase [Acidimicrobiales bacterium]
MASRLPLRSSSDEQTAVRGRDIVIAVGVAALEVAALGAAAHHQHVGRVLDPLSLVLLAVGPAALVVRRRYPVEVLIAVFVAALAYSLHAAGIDPLFFALIAAFASAVLRGHRVAAVTSMVAGYLGFLWLRPTLGVGHWPRLAGVVALAAWLLVLYAAAEAIRVRRERAAELEHIREAESRRRVSEERLRIARELHDVLAHNISLINVQAATTLHRAERNEERAYEALATIKKVSQETLVELRSLLGAMREVDEQAPRAPVPGLARLDDLVASSAAAGVAAHVEISGTSRPLPAAVDLAAYRILQEGLTNVARHAGTGQADIRVDYGDDEVVLQVDDEGPARGPLVAGTGITGMRERAAALGGELEVGRRPGGGTRLRSRLPLGTGDGDLADAAVGPDPVAAAGDGAAGADPVGAGVAPRGGQGTGPMAAGSAEGPAGAGVAARGGRSTAPVAAPRADEDS